MHEYLKNHIKEEIEGAMDYYTKAIELKKSAPMWSEKFFTMAGDINDEVGNPYYHDRAWLYNH